MSTREKGLNIIKSDGISRLETAEYGNIPLTQFDVFVNANSNDSLHQFAHKYYGDPSLWWLIALANNLLLPFNIPNGCALRIPPKNIIK